MPELSEHELVTAEMDRHAWGPTEPDEEQVLRRLGYVLNPQTGVYEGDPHDENEEGPR
ncbi:hypothetical protein [Streptosporangium saharense]|uniref:Uncharacterized protein n=1 Tax=Streptosporangium saharense TaxID=1706840 RepID=A0A7W7VLT5_9ACTN|nr:hypothetical protein [Streptosporangium saharense]MBB4915106.1 hypothetical protein [Streptosporangium saharense]